MRYTFSDITLYYYPQGDTARLFTLVQNEVSDAYVKLLKGYKPKSTTRISVDLAEDDDVRFYVGSILIAEAAFDKTAYWEANDKIRRIIILDTIHRISCLCADKYDWDRERFDVAYNTLYSVLNT